MVRALKGGLAASRACLQEVANLFEYAMVLKYRRNMEFEEWKDWQERKRKYEEREYLRTLRRQKLVETKQIGEKLLVRLTAKGWQQALRDKIRCANKSPKDGLCVVIFDVPEKERYVRDTLRNILKECGFDMIQKSVWATEKNVVNELCALLQGVNLQQWVRIIVGNEIKQSALWRTVTRLKA